MYFGYMVSHIGFFLSVPTLWNAAVYIVAWSLFALRIKHEEDFLVQNEEYATYRKTIRYRLIPGLW
jgi:protein-S-isoprenylcysteine O-methyltransferase Ste14